MESTTAADATGRRGAANADTGKPGPLQATRLSAAPRLSDVVSREHTPGCFSLAAQSDCAWIHSKRLL
eukprot:363050-Chlamydomonas_euryale.AAC.3